MKNPSQRTIVEDGIVDAFWIPPGSFLALDLIIIVMLPMFFVLYPFYVWGDGFLVVVIDNVIVVTGIMVVSVIGSASAGIWPVA